MHIAVLLMLTRRDARDPYHPTSSPHPAMYVDEACEPESAEGVVNRHDSRHIAHTGLRSVTQPNPLSPQCPLNAHDNHHSARTYDDEDMAAPLDHPSTEDNHGVEAQVDPYASASDQDAETSHEPFDDNEEDEESVDDRTDAELAAIALEIQELEDSVPLLKTSYHLLDRLGEGTFSSVYKAIDLHHNLYDNSHWTSYDASDENIPPASSDAKTFPSTNTSSSSNSMFDDINLFKPDKSTQRTFTPAGMSHDPFAAVIGEQATNKFTETLQRHALECGKLPIAYKTPQRGRPKDKGNVYVALKRIYVTSSPQRIMNELELMAQLRYVVMRISMNSDI